MKGMGRLGTGTPIKIRAPEGHENLAQGKPWETQIKMGAMKAARECCNAKERFFIT